MHCTTRLAGIALILGLTMGCAGTDAGGPDGAGAAGSEDAAGEDVRVPGGGDVAAAIELAGLDAPRGLIASGDGATVGYTFFSPLLSDTTYLIDHRGRVVKTWQADYAPSGWVYMLDNGNLLRGGRVPDVPVFSGGGQGGRIQEFTWDGELVWDFEFASEEHLLHHDVAVLPNGNLLAIAWESKTPEEALQAGRRPDLIPEAGIWADKIVELEPQRPGGAKVVWQWHTWDHLVQDFDESRDNYADPSQHPELVNTNGSGEAVEISDEELEQLKALGYVPEETTAEDVSSDVMHTNAIVYNAELDQIVISVPEFNEIWVIDHGTTTAEAAGHSGGRRGRGGDLLYRWGNPRNYGGGEESDRTLGYEHDVRWVDAGLPGAGNLTIFNNRVSGPEGDHSEVVEISPPIDGRGNYADASEWNVDPVWSYAAPDKLSFNSPFISGAHRLANGNTLITSGAQGRFFEVTPAKEIVWEYWTPYAGRVQMPDGSAPHPVGPFGYAVFRATKLPVDHPALAGRELLPLDPQPEPVAPPPAEGGSQD